MSQEGGMIWHGSIERGHEPAALASGVLRELVPHDWRWQVVDVERRALRMRIERPDGTRVWAEITHDAINDGMLRLAIAKAIEELRA